MTYADPESAGPQPADVASSSFLPVRVFNLLEDAVIVLTLAVMVVLPLLDLLLRRTTVVISGSTSFVQHGTLIVGMIGGSIAARRNRLLSLATLQLLPKGWPTTAARLAAGSVACLISGLLTLASAQYVASERQFGDILAYGLPKWVFELVMPIGFGLVTLRLLWHSGDRWLARLLTLLLAAGLTALCLWCPVDPQKLVIPFFVLLLIATVFGSPIFAVLGGAALILFWADQSPIASIPIDQYKLVTNPSLPMIPLFTLAGYFLAEGGASRRLVEVFAAVFAPLRGGPAIVCVLVCAFFTTFTGASGVTILALGGLLMPVLLSAHYTPRAALGLLTGSGSLGLLFPPCLPLVLYAIIGRLPIEQIFLAAILPGLLLLTLTAALGVWMGPSRRVAEAPPFDARRATAALWRAKWELLLPVVAMVSLFSGYATLVEAAAITACYALLTQTLLNRDLNVFRDVPRVMVECGLVIGGVLLILSVAQGLTTYFVQAQVADLAAEWVDQSIQSKLLFLLLLNLFLLIVGCLMDIYSAIVVVVPLLAPVAARFGIDPLHLGVIFLANLELGYLTPPVGLNLFLSSYRFGKPMGEVCRAILPILAVQLVGVLVITYVPPMTTLLPGLVYP